MAFATYHDRASAEYAKQMLATREILGKRPKVWQAQTVHARYLAHVMHQPTH
jgi:hypothetical protein